MQRKIFIIILIIISSNIALAQGVRAYLGYNQFFSPKDGQYIQAYINIEGGSLKWNKAENIYNSNVELTIIFKLDTSIIAYSKDVINSKAKDSLEINQLFMHTNNYLIKNGNYDIEIKIDDLNDTSKAIFSKSKFTINNPTDSIYCSSLEVFSHITKSDEDDPNVKGGYKLTPNIFRYLGSNDSILQFYAEVYNTSKILGNEEAYLLTYYLVNNSTNMEVSKLRKYKRMTSSPVNIVMGSFDISKLASGNYSLIMEIRDRENTLLTSNDYFFKRNNPNIKVSIDEVENVDIASTFVELIKGKDTLRNIIETFRPTSSVQEINLARTVMKDGDEFIMQQYIYSFWEKRNVNDPFIPFKEYMGRIKKCDKLYATRIKRGYETSRGRIYMQYGEANSIATEYNDPAAYPYEIWHYYEARGQRNIKFIFYNTDLASNEFELLHSNAAGERNDYQWRLHLRRDEAFRSIDDTGNKEDDWGSQYNNLYESPR